MVRIVDVPAPGTEGPIPPAFTAWSEIFSQSQLAELGHDDFVDPPSTLRASFADRVHMDKVLLLALRDEDAGAVDPHPNGVTDPNDVVGIAWLGLPRTDNTHLAMIDVMVRPAARGMGVGSALWATALDRVRASGRTTVTTWTAHAREADAADPDGLAAPTGVGRLRADDAAVRFARAAGFELEQTERQSTLAVPVPQQALRSWREEAQAVAGDEYRLTQWSDATPDAWVDQLAELQQRMSTDAPMAALDLREEDWDAARVRHDDETMAAQGQHYLLTAAEHVPTGTLAAFTQLVRNRQRPASVYQYNTLVRREHRGRRLGLLVKAANLELLAQEWPDARRVHTWNAGENRHMLAINERIGFRAASVEGAWQLRL